MSKYANAAAVADDAMWVDVVMRRSTGGVGVTFSRDAGT